MGNLEAIWSTTQRISLDIVADDTEGTFSILFEAESRCSSFGEEFDRPIFV